ncbi:hypothetical protein [Chryseobacterium sp. G0201]|uniref:hypothetical protein n=1 Tax=Chryseobacterium sp. G0201 TaxID=2487065 RepID=UPI000F516082|nr:hypothetical protein [Chryseobacterium sp. G0201]AZA52604.1 hypothetical protein EG348_06100 [Chryseobacterium sp. G0201]
MQTINYIKSIIENPKIDYTETLKDYFKNETKSTKIAAFINATNEGIITSIFQSNQELWLDFDKSDWIEILKTTNRTSVSEVFDVKLINTNCFDDLKLLNKYLKINPFELLFEAKDTIAKENMLNCFKFGMQFSGLFFEDEVFFKETYDDFWNISYNKLKEYSHDLITQGCEKRIDTPEELYSWLEEKIKIV